MKKLTKADQVYKYVSSKLRYLSETGDTGYRRGLFANLRRGVGKTPGELPELWGMIFNYIPDELLGKNKNISHSEWAVYTALTLYALHQQGNEQNMNCTKISVGEAAAKYAKKNECEERILDRLRLVATAESQYDLAYHLRGIIQLLSKDGIQLDYPKLAKEIYLMNYDNEATAVTLSWGRDFARICYPYTEEKENNNNE